MPLSASLGLSCISGAFLFIFEPLFIVFGRTGEVKKSISIFVWSPNDSIWLSHKLSFACTIQVTKFLWWFFLSDALNKTTNIEIHSAPLLWFPFSHIWINFLICCLQFWVTFCPFSLRCADILSFSSGGLLTVLI